MLGLHKYMYIISKGGYNLVHVSFKTRSLSIYIPKTPCMLASHSRYSNSNVEPLTVVVCEKHFRIFLNTDSIRRVEQVVIYYPLSIYLVESTCSSRQPYSLPSDRQYAVTGSLGKWNTGCYLVIIKCIP